MGIKIEIINDVQVCWYESFDPKWAGDVINSLSQVVIRGLRFNTLRR